MQLKKKMLWLILLACGLPVLWIPRNLRELIQALLSAPAAAEQQRICAKRSSSGPDFR